MSSNFYFFNFNLNLRFTSLAIFISSAQYWTRYISCYSIIIIITLKYIVIIVYKIHGIAVKNTYRLYTSEEVHVYMLLLFTSTKFNDCHYLSLFVIIRSSLFCHYSVIIRSLFVIIRSLLFCHYSVIIRSLFVIISHYFSLFGHYLVIIGHYFSLLVII